MSIVIVIGCHYWQFLFPIFQTEIIECCIPLSHFQVFILWKRFPLGQQPHTQSGMPELGFALSLTCDIEFMKPLNFG